MRFFIFASACALALSAAANAASPDHCSDNAPDAPVGVMGAHLHPKGKWMASYRYNRVGQTSLRDGTSRIETHEALETYSEVPTKMQLDMHMVEGMVGVSDKLTLMAMAQYMEMDMVHQAHHSDHRHAMTKKGLGDTQLTALYGLWDGVHLHAGLSLPTGSIDQGYVNHHNKELNLPYNMQFGSGTFDPILGATYRQRAGQWSWGAQALGTFRVYDNANDYHFGNRYQANLWAGKTLTDAVEATLRLEGIHQGDVRGMDIRIPATSMAGATPALTGSDQINAYLGVAYSPPLKALEGQKLALEFGAPVYQRFDGPQLETDYRLTAGWRIGF